MKSDLKFIGWKLGELAIYVLGFPFLVVGCWAMEASDWFHDRAIPYDRRNPEQKVDVDDR